VEGVNEDVKKCSPAMTAQRHKDKLKHGTPTMATMLDQKQEGSPVKNQRNTGETDEGADGLAGEEPARNTDVRMR
jgi:hypothetical protein